MHRRVKRRPPPISSWVTLSMCGLSGKQANLRRARRPRQRSWVGVALCAKSLKPCPDAVRTPASGPGISGRTPRTLFSANSQLMQHRAGAFVMQGEDESAQSESQGGEPFVRKRRCHVWFDALVRALYCDLQANSPRAGAACLHASEFLACAQVFAEWHQEDEHAAASEARAGSEDGLGAGATALGGSGSLGGGVSGGGAGAAGGNGGNATSFEWIQRARLATRLKQPIHAATAWASAIRQLEEVLRTVQKKAHWRLAKGLRDTARFGMIRSLP